MSRIDLLELLGVWFDLGHLDHASNETLQRPACKSIAQASGEEGLGILPPISKIATEVSR